MEELTRLQLVTEAVLEFKVQMKSDLDIERIGRMVLDIVRDYQDLQLYELVHNAYSQRNDRQVALDCLSEAISYLHCQIDHH